MSTQHLSSTVVLEDEFKLESFTIEFPEGKSMPVKAIGTVRYSAGDRNTAPESSDIQNMELEFDENELLDANVYFEHEESTRTPITDLQKSTYDELYDELEEALKDFFTERDDWDVDDITP